MFKKYLEKRRQDAVVRDGLRRYVELEYRQDPQIAYYRLLKEAGLVK